MNERVEWDVANRRREQIYDHAVRRQGKLSSVRFQAAHFEFRWHANNFSWLLWITHPIYPMLEDIISQWGEVQDSLYTLLRGGKSLRECMRRNLLVFTFMIQFYIWVCIDWKEVLTSNLFYLLIAYLRLIRMAESVLLKYVLCRSLFQTRLRPWFLTGLSRNILQSIPTNNSTKETQIIAQQFPSINFRVCSLNCQYQHMHNVTG